MDWVSKKAIAEIKADGRYPFDIEVDYFDDKCSRNFGMMQFITKASNLSGPNYHGIIGSGCSGVCGGIAEIAPLWGLVVLSWAQYNQIAAIPNRR